MGGPMGPGTSKRGPPWRLVMLAVVVLLLAMTWPAEGVGRCRRPPRFSVDGAEPMALARGRVTLVALLTSTCSFCISQARSLETLQQNLRDRGNDVHMMIINGGPRPRPGQRGVFERIVSFDVYHDDNDRTTWEQVFRGNKDDILVFNRCGMLTYRIRFPYSYLGYQFVSRALNYTATNTALCNSACDPQRITPQRRQDRITPQRRQDRITPQRRQDRLHNRMMGDAPVAARYGGMRDESHTGTDHRRAHASFGQGRSNVGRRRGRGYRGNRRGSRRNTNRSRCAEGDELCRELRRGRRRYNRFRSQHSFGLHSQGREEEILRMYGLGHGRGAAAPAV